MRGLRGYFACGAVGVSKIKSDLGGIWGDDT